LCAEYPHASAKQRKEVRVIDRARTVLKTVLQSSRYYVHNLLCSSSIRGWVSGFVGANPGLKLVLCLGRSGPSGTGPLSFIEKTRIPEINAQVFSYTYELLCNREIVSSFDLATSTLLEQKQGVGTKSHVSLP
jgi:hypothetical protein